MTANVPFNYSATTNAAAFFAAVSDGFTQGVAQDDPVYRNWLAGGVVDAGETLPMWGGVGLFVGTNEIQVPVTNTPSPIGPRIGRATSVTAGASKQLTGFSVFDQSFNAVITPNSNVPLAGSGMGFNFYRLGSRAKIPVACSASLLSQFAAGVSEATQVSWDFVGQLLVPFAAAYGATAFTGFTFATTGGGQTTLTGVASDLSASLTAGTVVDLSGVVVTGSPTQSLNGTWTVVSSTSNTVVLSTPAASNPFGTYASGGTIAAGGGALPVIVEAVQANGNKLVNYNATAQTANWNNTGAIALIRL